MLEKDGPHFLKIPLVETESQSSDLSGKGNFLKESGIRNLSGAFSSFALSLSSHSRHRSFSLCLCHFFSCTELSFFITPVVSDLK